MKELCKVCAQLIEDNPDTQDRPRIDFSRNGSIHMQGEGITDPGALKGVRFEQLRLLDNRNLEDIHLLSCMPLTSLFLIRSNVADINALKDINGLRSLSIAESQVGDISPLAVKRLESLSINDTDVTPLAAMTSLRHLAFTPYQIENGIDALRKRRLESIGTRWDNRIPAQQFWRRYDNGDFRRKR